MNNRNVALISNKGPVLANKENRPSQIPGQAGFLEKFKKEVSIRPAAARVATSLSFSGRQPSVGAALQNRSAFLSNVPQNQSIRSQKALDDAKKAEAQVRPDDWIIVPPMKPRDVFNIDTDMESHLMCPSLAPSQYQYLMSIEEKFMTDVGFLNRTKIDAPGRLSIVNWMTTVHRQFAEQQESLFLAVNYLDRFYAVCPNGAPSISQLLSPGSMAQRVAATALYVACKYEEIYAPSIDQVCGATDAPRATPAEIRKVEFDMLRALRFRVNPPLLNHFLRRCSKAAGATALLHSLGKYLIEVALYDPELATGTKPSLVAAAASYVAIQVFGERTREWDETMIHYSGGYSELEVRPVAVKLIAAHRLLANREGSMLVKAKWEDMIKHSVFSEWVRIGSM